MTPKEVVGNVFSAFQRGDIPYILRQVAPAAMWRQSAMLPWGGEFHGPEGAGQFFSSLDAVMETTAFAVDDMIESGEEVFAFGYYEGKARGTGRTAGARWAFRWRVVNGKIELYDGHIDTAALLGALN